MKYIILARAPREREWEQIEIHDSEQAAVDAIEVLEQQSPGPWQYRIEETF